jgi:hypothetical protein
MKSVNQATRAKSISVSGLTPSCFTTICCSAQLALRRFRYKIKTMIVFREQSPASLLPAHQHDGGQDKDSSKKRKDRNESNDAIIELQSSKVEKRQAESDGRPQLGINTDLKPHIVGHITDAQIETDDGEAIDVSSAHWNLRSDTDQEVMVAEDVDPEPTFADLVRDLYDDLAAVWKRNEWGTCSCDDNGKIGIDYNVEMITGAGEPRATHIIPDSSALSHRIMQFLIMDGVFDKLPSQVSKENFIQYLDKHNIQKISARHIYLTGTFFGSRTFEDEKGEIIMMPTKALILRLIKLAEDKAVSMEKSRDPFPEEHFNCTKWVSAEDWMDPAKGVWQGAQQQDEQPYSVTRTDREDQLIQVPLYQYQLSIFKNLPFTCFNYKEVKRLDGSIEISEVDITNHISKTTSGRPYNYDKPIKPFSLSLEPIFVILVFIHSFQTQQEKLLDRRKNETAWDAILEIMELSLYYMKLVTMDYPSQFRLLGFIRPDSIPFDGPVEIEKELCNYTERKSYLGISDWSIPIFSSSQLVDDYLNQSLTDSVLSTLQDQLDDHKASTVELGKSLYEASRRLGLQYAEAAEQYRKTEQVSMNEVKFWLLTTKQLNKLDERVRCLEEGIKYIKSIILYNDFDGDVIDEIYQIDPGMKAEHSQLYPLDRYKYYSYL